MKFNIDDIVEKAYLTGRISAHAMYSMSVDEKRRFAEGQIAMASPAQTPFLSYLASTSGTSKITVNDEPEMGLRLKLPEAHAIVKFGQLQANSRPIDRLVRSDKVSQIEDDITRDWDRHKWFCFTVAVTVTVYGLITGAF